MNANVKEVINHILRDERNELKPKKRKPRIKGGLYDLPFIPNIKNVENFTAFLNCELSPIICPILDENLIPVNNTTLYCPICKKNVYKVDSIERYKQLSLKKECMSISQELFESISPNIEKKDAQNLKERLKISRLFLIYRYLGERNYPVSIEGTIEVQIKEILLGILFSNKWKENLIEYSSYGVDFEYLFFKVCPRLNDKLFLDTIDRLFKKYLEEL